MMTMTNTDVAKLAHNAINAFQAEMNRIHPALRDAVADWTEQATAYARTAGMSDHVAAVFGWAYGSVAARFETRDPAIAALPPFGAALASFKASGRIVDFWGQVLFAGV